MAFYDTVTVSMDKQEDSKIKILMVFFLQSLGEKSIKKCVNRYLEMEALVFCSFFFFLASYFQSLEEGGFPYVEEISLPQASQSRLSDIGFQKKNNNKKLII